MVRTVVQLVEVCQWSGSHCCTVSRWFVSGVVRTVVQLVEVCQWSGSYCCTVS